MQVRWRVDADLHQAAAMSCEALRRWPVVFLPIDQAEGQSARRSHRAPSLELTGDDRSQLDQPVHQATIGNLEIEMNPRAMVPDLLVDVGVALGWGKATKFRVPRPRLADRPA
ncbi:MAG TPA: hypothetical protein VK754_09155 [Propionibacteriaceae bacterium]|nr:hypothetical protein [Propionibacteriaceae bacterium]